LAAAGAELVVAVNWERVRAAFQSLRADWATLFQEVAPSVRGKARGDAVASS
jgi:hypothetical protein